MSIARIIWDNCRRQDGSINLELAYIQTGCHLGGDALKYLRMVETVMPINSRQAAAVAITTAMYIEAAQPSR